VGFDNGVRVHHLNGLWLRIWDHF